MRLKIVVILCLLPVIVSGSTLKRFDSLYLAALREAGVDSTSNQMSLVTVKANVNIAVQQVSSDFDAVQKSGTITCADGTASYAMDTTFRRLIWCRIWKSDEDGKLYPLRVVLGQSLYESVQEGKTEPETLDKPGYAYSWGKTLHVHPVPSFADTIYYGYAAIGCHLSSDSDTTDVLEPYRYLIALYAGMLIRKDLLLDHGTLWTEYQAARLGVVKPE